MCVIVVYRLDERGSELLNFSSTPTSSERRVKEYMRLDHAGQIVTSSFVLIRLDSAIMVVVCCSNSSINLVFVGVGLLHPKI